MRRFFRTTALCAFLFYSGLLAVWFGACALMGFLYMASFVIDHGIPPPLADARSKRGQGRPCTLPWYLLEVGTSVLLQTEQARQAGLQWARINNVVFISRKIPRKGWRIWRMA